MATYKITAPDGNSYNVTAPDTASQADVLAYAKANYSKAESATKGPSMSDKFTTGLQNAGSAIETGMSKVAPFMAAGQKIQDTVMPGSGIPEMAQNAVMHGFDKLGGAASEAIGKNFPKANPLVGGGIGMGIANLPALLAPGGAEVGAGRFMKPAVPAERMPGVMAALREGVPLSRAEQTGGKFMTGVENFTEKSVMGSGTMEKARAGADSAMEALKARILEPLGVPKEKWEVGYQAKPAMAGREGSMRVAKDNLFSSVPEGVNIPLKGGKELADTLTQEQSKLYKGTRDPEVLKWSKIVADAETSSGKGVKGGLEVKGVTTQVPDTKIPARTETKQSSLLGPNGKPATYEVKTPEQTVKGGPEYGVKYSVGPEASATDSKASLGRFRNFMEQWRAQNGQVIVPDQGVPGKAGAVPEEPLVEKPNYYPLKRLREQLGEAVRTAKAEGKFTRMRDLSRLKAAVDGDIEAFASAKVSPLDDMVAQEFKSSYQKANAFSGAYKNLFKSDLAADIETLPPEKILDKVFQKNSETTIKKFRALVGEEAFQAAKSRWVNDLLESPNISNAISRKKIDPGTLNAILSGPEQQKIASYGEIQKLRKTVQSQQGSQGSARSNIHGGQWAGLGAGIAELLRGNFVTGGLGVGQFLAPFPAAKALVSDAVTKGIPASMGPATTNMGIRAMLMKRREKEL